ncbi:MAG: hypothetical protein ACFFCZ_03490 [Promethearchaeota archaeon]
MDIPIERDQKYQIRPERDTASYRTEIGEFEGRYIASKTYPAIWYVKRQKYLSCALEKELELPTGTVVKVKGHFKMVNRELPSGKKYQARVLEVTSSEKIAEPLEEELLDNLRGQSVHLMKEETRIESLDQEEPEVSIIQKVMWDVDHHNWIVGHFMHPPIKKMGSAVFQALDKEKKPVRAIISELQGQIIE